jgi:probable F420-dependent oxidoreductase
MRAFRFGVQGAPVPTEPAWADVARRAEDHGYDVLSMPDHLDGRLAPIVALAYAAAITDRIRLGTTVLAADFRNPALLVREVATLDELARHRVELGLGAGWMATDYEVAGIPFAPARERIDRLAALVPVVRAALRADLPLMLGGGGRRMLELAGRVADIVGIVTANPGGVAGRLEESGTLAATCEKIGWVRDAAGDRFSEIELNTRVWTAEPEAVSAMGAEAAASPHVMVRPARVMADKLLRLRDATGISYVTVSVRFLDELAPVIELLSGR